MSYEEFLREINSEEYIFLDRLYELGDEEELVIKLMGAKLRPTDEEDIAEMAEEFGQKAAEIARGSRAIEPDESKRWRLTFEQYISYAVISESYDSGDRATFDKPCLACVVEDSDWLDYAKKSTFAFQIYEGIKHYNINCLNHIINVAAENEPLVERIEN